MSQLKVFVFVVTVMGVSPINFVTSDITADKCMDLSCKKGHERIRRLGSASECRARRSRRGRMKDQRRRRKKQKLAQEARDREHRERVKLFGRHLMETFVHQVEKKEPQERFTFRVG